MIRALFLLGALVNASAQEIQGPPLWAIQGIAFTETRSYWDADGKFHYVDRRPGSHGERGPFQCTHDAFRDVCRPGERFEDLARDPAFACDIACRYLARLYSRTGNWSRAVRNYNTGAGKHLDSGEDYLSAVKLAGLQRIYSQGEVQ